MLTVAVNTIAKTRNNPNVPTTSKWIKKLWYIHIYIHMEYFAVIRNDEIVPFARNWKVPC